MAHVLQTSRRDSVRIARENLFNLLLLQLEGRALASRGIKGLVRDARRVSSAECDVLEWASEQKSVILAALHTGAYPLGLTWILHKFFRGRRILIVKKGAAVGIEPRALARLRQMEIDAEVWTVDDGVPPVDLLRAFKAGGVLIVMADLPPTYGRSHEAEILWRPGHLALGLVDIALVCSSPILLYRTQSSCSSDVIEVDGIIDVDRRDPDVRRTVARRISAFMTESIVARPQQWLFWAKLNEFYVNSGGVRHERA